MLDKTCFKEDSSFSCLQKNKSMSLGRQKFMKIARILPSESFISRGKSQSKDAIRERRQNGKTYKQSACIKRRKSKKFNRLTRFSTLPKALTPALFLFFFSFFFFFYPVEVLLFLWETTSSSWKFSSLTSSPIGQAYWQRLKTVAMLVKLLLRKCPAAPLVISATSYEL